MIARIRKQFKPHDKLSPEEVQRGLKLVVWDGVCSGAMGALQGGAFLAAFALALGATNFEIGILAAIPLFTQISQVAAIYLIEAVRNRKAITVIFTVASRMAWVIIIFIPFLFLGEQGVTLLMSAMFISSILGPIGGISWGSMLRDFIPENTIGNVFSRRMFLSAILALSLTLLGGQFVDFWKKGHSELHAYSIIFAGGLLFGLVGCYFLIRTPEPAMEPRDKIQYSPWELLARPFTDQNFRSLILFASIWNFAINLATPFFTVYMLKRLGLDLFLVTVFITISQVTNIMFVRIWGRLADRFSNKSVLSLSGTLFLVAIIAWTFTTMPEKYFLTLPLLGLIHFLSGMSLAGVSLASGNITLKLAPRGQATAYLASHGLVSSAVASTAPLLGGILADFFAVRGLSFTLSWAEPGRDLTLYALSFRALDFLFLIAFIVGLYSLQRLASVREEGEVEEDIVIGQLLAEVARVEKNVSSVGGLRYLTAIPLHLVYHSLRAMSRVRPRGRRRARTQPHTSNQG